MTDALALIRRFEACRLTAYPDPYSPRAVRLRATGISDKAFPGDPWTVGWGCTGPGIEDGTKWTQEFADAELEKRVAELQTRIRGALRVAVSLDQMAALTSLGWNVEAAVKPESTLMRLLNSGDAARAGDEFLKWCHARGRVIPELQFRRALERSVFLSEDVTPTVVMKEPTE